MDNVVSINKTSVTKCSKNIRYFMMDDSDCYLQTLVKQYKQRKGLATDVHFDISDKSNVVRTGHKKKKTQKYSKWKEDYTTCKPEVVKIEDEKIIVMNDTKFRANSNLLDEENHFASVTTGHRILEYNINCVEEDKDYRQSFSETTSKRSKKQKRKRSKESRSNVKAVCNIGLDFNTDRDVDQTLTIFKDDMGNNVGIHCPVPTLVDLCTKVLSNLKHQLRNNSQVAQIARKWIQSLAIDKNVDKKSMNYILQTVSKNAIHGEEHAIDVRTVFGSYHTLNGSSDWSDKYRCLLNEKTENHFGIIAFYMNTILPEHIFTPENDNWQKDRRFITVVEKLKAILSSSRALLAKSGYSHDRRNKTLPFPPANVRFTHPREK